MRRTPETKTVGHGPLPSGTLASLLVMVLECRRSRTSYGLLQRNIAHFSFPFCTIDEDDEDDSDWEFDESWNIQVENPPYPSYFMDLAWMTRSRQMEEEEGRLDVERWRFLCCLNAFSSSFRWKSWFLMVDKISGFLKLKLLSRSQPRNSVRIMSLFNWSLHCQLQHTCKRHILILFLRSVPSPYHHSTPRNLPKIVSCWPCARKELFVAIAFHFSNCSPVATV